MDGGVKGAGERCGWLGLVGAAGQRVKGEGRQQVQELEQEQEQECECL
jgi:hypothetical protein